MSDRKEPQGGIINVTELAQLIAITIQNRKPDLGAHWHLAQYRSFINTIITAREALIIEGDTKIPGKGNQRIFTLDEVERILNHIKNNPPHKERPNQLSPSCYPTEEDVEVILSQLSNRRD